MNYDFIFLISFGVLVLAIISVYGFHFRQDIPKDYKDLFDEWDNFQCIIIYSELTCWRLLIRKRDDYHCATIEDGWRKMRDDLALIVGNISVFECPIQSYDQFKIRVLPPDEVI